MEQYYAERNGLLKDKLQIDLNEFKDYFLQIYRYFKNKECFDIAENGVWKFNTREQIVPPTLAPSPEMFFAVQMQDQDVWPIYENIENYDEATLFSVIEILYEHIAVYDYTKDKIEKDEVKEEYAGMINNILVAYDEGFYLEPKNGVIMKVPNEALKRQLSCDARVLPDDVLEKMSTAVAMFYRFDSNLEEKKKAITILADILENEREELKDLFNSEYDIPKNEHDKLIFEIVNGFNIRHNRADQRSDYSREIWYDWMMQYYTSVIIAFFKLRNQMEE